MRGKALLMVAGSAAGLLLAATAPRHAAATRADEPRRLPLPASASGRTEGGSTHGGKREISCADAKSVVWYDFGVSRRGPILVRVRAYGALNAVVGIFRERRGHGREIGCRLTDGRGKAQIAVWGKRGDDLIIGVGRRRKSADGSFRLDVRQAELPARPPGRPLPAAGTSSSLDAFLDPDDAWSVALRSGTTYRINVLPQARTDCISAYLFRPDTIAFDEEDAVVELPCGGYALFTPGPDGGGRYTLHLDAAPDVAGPQRYRLQVARAGVDDTAPGVELANPSELDGTLFGRGVDVVDLYHFLVVKRSMFKATVLTHPRVAFDAFLVGSAGGRVGAVRSERPGRVELHRELDPGLYYLVLRSRERSGGRYHLGATVREVTETHMTVDGERRVESVPEAPHELVSTVSPAAVGGVVRFQVDRFDPLAGWQFDGFVVAQVGADGVARASWTPPAPGRWRLRARFLGTREASPSESGTSRVIVGPPPDGVSS